MPSIISKLSLCFDKIDNLEGKNDGCNFSIGEGSCHYNSFLLGNEEHFHAKPRRR